MDMFLEIQIMSLFLGPPQGLGRSHLAYGIDTLGFLIKLRGEEGGRGRKEGTLCLSKLVPARIRSFRSSRPDSAKWVAPCQEGTTYLAERFRRERKLQIGARNPYFQFLITVIARLSQSNLKKAVRRLARDLWSSNHGWICKGVDKKIMGFRSRMKSKKNKLRWIMEELILNNVKRRFY